MLGMEDKPARLRMDGKGMRWILLPRGIMAAEPAARDSFLESIGGDRRATIGGACYYIAVMDNAAYLCRHPRETVGGKDLEVLDHDLHGISTDDLEDAVRKAAGEHLVPGHYPLSPHIEQMLRAQLEP
jgi:hypothetical protein